MASDPSYVRLANRLSRGMVADVQNSGWSIAGLDVRKFPEDPQAQKFVRKALNDGKLEPASKGEWEDAHDDGGFADVVREQNPDFGHSPQEAQIQLAAQKARAALAEKRGDQRDPEEAYDEDVRQPRQSRAAGLAGDVDPDSLGDMSKQQLVDVARRLGLATSGNKDDLLDRIEEHVENTQEQGEDE